MSIIPRCIVLALAALIALFAAEPASAQDSTAKITIAVWLNGPSSLLGQLSLYGARLAIEEANASGERPRVELTGYDDVGDPSRGRAIAEQITASGVLAVIGPASTPMALAVEPAYAEHGLVAIGTSATGDATTNATTFFRSTYSTSEAVNRSLVTFSTHLAIFARAFCSRITVTANPRRLETGRRAARHNGEIRVVHENGGDGRLGALGRR
jgi:ABC-type branched-subunit amino acid transport system substrate-binding protein